MKSKRLLIVEDDTTLKIALFRALTKLGYSATTASTHMEAQSWLSGQTQWDAVLLDLQLPDGNGITLLTEIKAKSPSTPVIILTGSSSVERAVEATQKGAFNFLVKPVSLDDVVQSLSSALTESQKLTPAPEANILTKRPTPEIIGHSEGIKQVLELVHRVADSDATILIQGESGTGKELIARAIHHLSPRKKAPFIAINCGAIPAELLESELFGHVKGAFTGAIANRVGRFELADGGILFLDEIGDMSPSLQVKILRALQERSFEPVGSTKSVQVNVQVITATHINLERAVSEGRFREDLFYRLNVIPILIPPLRERPEDIPVLLQHFLKSFATRRKECLTGFSPEALLSLKNYPWPGNIRELENLMERLSIVKGRGIVELKDLPTKYHVKIPAGASMSPHVSNSELPAEGLDFNAAVDHFENSLILRALEKTGWNRNQAAHLLRLNRTTLVEKMKKKGLKPQDEMMDNSAEDLTCLHSSP